MRNSKISWAVLAGALVAVLIGVGVAIAVGRGSGDGRQAAPAPSAAAPSPAVEPPATSPPPPPGADITGPLDLVLLGVDTRTSVPDWEPHSDTVMLLHVEADLRSAYLYSLPRDLRVEMPAYPKAGFRGGRHKITDAMAYGSRVPGSNRKNVANGYELLTLSLSRYTGIKTFQAGAVLNFRGLAKLTDELGGIDLVVDQKVVSRHRKPDGSLRPLAPGGGDHVGPQAVYLPGRRHLVGWQALDYARQRYGLPGGDYDRQRHHRQLVEALLAKVREQDLSNNPDRLRGIVDALGETLVYVGGRSPLEYAYALRDLTPERITSVQLPGAGIGRGSGYLGEQLKPEGRGFLTAVARNQVPAYLRAHPELVSR